MAMIAYFEDFEPKNDRRRYLRRALRLGTGSSGEIVCIHEGPASDCPR